MLEMRRMMLTMMAVLLIGASPAAAQNKDGLRARIFAHPADEVYRAAVALAVDRGYAEHGPVLPDATVPVLLDWHQTLEIGGEHIDLYVRRANGHARLLIESLRPEMTRSARKQLAAYLDDLDKRLSQKGG